MALCKTAVSLLLTHCRYDSLVLNYRYYMCHFAKKSYDEIFTLILGIVTLQHLQSQSSAMKPFIYGHNLFSHIVFRLWGYKPTINKEILGCQPLLTHWGRDKMVVISQTTFSNSFSLNENVRIPIKISLKFVPKCSINNIPSLVQIMAWRRSGDKPLSEPMMVSLPTHMCVTRPQWVNP